MNLQVDIEALVNKHLVFSLITLKRKKAKEFHLLVQNWQLCEHGKYQTLVMERLHDIKEQNNRNMDEI